ncbi:hypothetical protein HanRHA438_Chr07g0306681 [Helianthus annuus]|uniref:Uncharacterized protein n=1 Tax=Helianthus annuus TaxID=4232 RepID=A0A251UCA1_HELAN|nr:hypothetical protein HanXRQr2_Chr07g0296381 [Helianthus annuus]KAJ0550296.1 hypothetical protein HanHA300_Chr07g0243811 [Helianthus annuus]KAJ0556977.1 hypothetical protein HanIR_Chr07g0319931 [Helianthus annuus]KAJ0563250.1 hypothetical protein HanHA89_Chr07g0260991 [Helianthus annuus]KAJ0731357.1 hypothetical protein HanOQP8_Chr07g0251041 [Helianthus annuus]
MLHRPCRRCEGSHGCHRSRSLSRLQNQPLLSRTLCAQGALDPKKVEGKILLCLSDQLQNHEAYTVNVVTSFLSSYKDHLEPAIANLRKVLQSLKGYIVIALSFIILPLYIKSVLIRIMKHW